MLILDDRLVVFDDYSLLEQHNVVIGRLVFVIVDANGDRLILSLRESGRIFAGD